MQARTNTLCTVVVDCPPAIARRTLRSAVDSAIDAKLRHAVLARAHVRYEVATNRFQHVRMILLWLVRARTHTNALRSCMVDSEPTVTRRALHGAINGTICPCCPNAILACARSRYAIGQQTNSQSHHGFLDLFCDL